MTHALAVRRAGTPDRSRIAAIFAAAFQDDPIFAFIFPDPAVRRARLPAFMEVIVASDMAVGACYATADGAAATTWRPPGRGYLSFAEMLVQAWPWIAAARLGLGRALLVSAASDAHHPRDPHWYLHMAGCVPNQQGRGLGGAAIRAGLARCDAAGLPAYLETAMERNLPLYVSLGFRVTGEWRIRNGPRCWSLLRPAAGPLPGGN